MSYRIVFFGTPEFAVPPFKALIQSSYQVVGLVCQQDKPSGRGYQLKAPPTKEVALQHGIPVLQPEKIRNNTEFLEQLKALSPDFLITAAYGKILPKAVLDIPKIAPLNIHASLLPKYRGASPIQWVVANGDAITGVTIMKMDEGMDTGDILLQEEIPIEASDTAGTLSEKLSHLGAKLILEALDRYPGLTPQVQDSHLATFTKLIEKEDGKIDWNQPAERLANLIRGMDPWPGTFVDGQAGPIKILAGTLYSEENDPVFLPGMVFDIIKNEGIVIQTLKGKLLVSKVQPAGKKAISAWDFANGARLKKGDFLG